MLLRTLRGPATCLALACLPASLLTTTAVLADKPAWKPMAELLVVSIGESDPAGMAQVMNRCTALNITLAGMLSDYSPEMSTHYETEALSMMQQGVLIDSQIEEDITGMQADISVLSAATMDKVRELLGGYSNWMDHNMDAGGTYFTDEIEMEMDSCNLASKFIAQMQTD